MHVLRAVTKVMCYVTHVLVIRASRNSLLKVKNSPLPALKIPEYSCCQKHYIFVVYIGLVLTLCVYLRTAAVVVCLLRKVGNNYIAL